MDTNQENGKFTMMTDILVLSTSDGEQPQKEIDIKIPTHMITDNNNVAVLASKHGGCSDSINDWEVIDHIHDSNTDAVSFQTKQFAL
jgi:hypothetical protein